MTLDIVASVTAAVIFSAALITLYKTRSYRDRDQAFVVRVLALAMAVVGVAFCVFISGLLTDMRRLTVVGGLALIGSYIILDRVERVAGVLGLLKK